MSAGSSAEAPADSQPSARRVQVWTAGPFLAMAALCIAFAFVGLAASCYWIDELFTLFVVDHGGGLGEVLRRALTDTHPPAYYFLSYGWVQLFGSSETAYRGLSAALVSAGLLILFFGLRGTFSLPARAFALATAAGSKGFIEQSQNIRNYALAIPLAAAAIAAALAIQRRMARGDAPSSTLYAGLWALALAGSFTHFYLFLAMGGVYLFLLLQARNARERWIIVASGASVAALMSLYAASLLHHTLQQFGHMWFSNAPKALVSQFFWAVNRLWTGPALVGLAVLVLAPWRDRLAAAAGRPRPAPPIPLAPLGLAAAGIGLTVGAGLAVSFLLAPSFGGRNLMVLGPFFWMLAAWLYDAIAPDPRGLGGRLLIGFLVLVTAANVLMIRGRFEPRAEDWRGSAAYVDSLARCRDQPIPVVLPFLFGPDTPFFRHLAERYFFGRYAQHPELLRAYAPADFAPRTADPGLAALLRARATTPGACPVVAWGVHDLAKRDVEPLRRQLAETAGVSAAQVVVRPFPHRKLTLLGGTKDVNGAYVFILAPSSAH